VPQISAESYSHLMTYDGIGGRLVCAEHG